MTIIDHFGILAPYYEKFIQPKDPKKLITFARLPTSGAILDAGGGTGRVAQTINNKASKVVIADLSLDMLHQAQVKLDLITVCTHTELLPFPDESFERVIMVDAFHHVKSHKESSSEMWRVLKPGGRLVIEEPDVRKLSIKVVALIEKLALMRSFFVPPQRIAQFFEYPNAEVKLEYEGYNSWIIVDKMCN